MSKFSSWLFLLYKWPTINQLSILTDLTINLNVLLKDNFFQQLDHINIQFSNSSCNIKNICPLYNIHYCFCVQTKANCVTLSLWASQFYATTAIMRSKCKSIYCHLWAHIWLWQMMKLRVNITFFFALPSKYYAIPARWKSQKWERNRKKC